MKRMTRLLARHAASRESAAGTAERDAHTRPKRSHGADCEPIGVALAPGSAEVKVTLKKVDVRVRRGIRRR